MAFLEKVLADPEKVQPLLDRHPEYQELAKRMTNLHNDITAKALEIENNQ
jgi:hypothetical protein